MALANGNGARPHVLDRSRAMLTERGSALTASMLRDLEAGGRIEADHIVGDLLRRGADHGVPTPHLGIAYTHLKAYENRRDRAAAR